MRQWENGDEKAGKRCDLGNTLEEARAKMVDILTRDEPMIGEVFTNDGLTDALCVIAVAQNKFNPDTKMVVYFNLTADTEEGMNTAYYQPLKEFTDRHYMIGMR